MKQFSPSLTCFYVRDRARRLHGRHTSAPANPTLSSSIQDKSYRKTPVTDTFAQTTFDNSEFEPPSRVVRFLRISAEFNSGFLIMDILLFAPLTFFNLHQVYPYYNSTLKRESFFFKDKEGDDWQEFRPTQAEALRAQEYFSS